uniref:YcfL family protein n=1 Tax=Thaumasiovibrio occultus TaxID=1891184 RepID=UPI000B34B46F|nr:DUF1425 domain-containing protein [Thaumasiovibrio occultus]
MTGHWFAVLGISLSLLGCAQPRVGLSLDDSDRVVVINEENLTSRLAVGHPYSEVVNNQLTANVALHNLGAEPLALQYHVVWYDNQGLEFTPQAMQWRPVLLNSRRQGEKDIVISDIAPEPRATQFRFLIRAR